MRFIRVAQNVYAGHIISDDGDLLDPNAPLPTNIVLVYIAKGQDGWRWQALNVVTSEDLYESALLPSYADCKTQAEQWIVATGQTS